MRKGNTITLNTLRPNVVRMNGQPWAPGGPAVGGGGIVPLPPTEPEEPVVPPVPTYVLAVEVQNGSAAATLGGVAVQLPYTANEGDTLLVTITPAEGYTFEAWADGNTDNPRSITMASDVVLSAECIAVPSEIKYIQFEDKAVEAICVANWSSDGIGLTEEDAAKVEEIPNSVFQYNKEIVSFNELQYFTGLKYLGSYWEDDKGTFAECTSLKSVVIPMQVTDIRHRAFQGCTSLESVNISHLTNIGSYSFRETAFKGEVYCPNLQSIGYSAFARCKNLTKVVDLGKVTDLRGAKWETDLTLGAFAQCASLESVIINDCVESIGYNMFYASTALQSVITRATTPPTLANVNAFTYTNNCPIYVPDASLEAYKTATNWNSYADRIHPLSEIEGDNGVIKYDGLVGAYTFKGRSNEDADYDLVQDRSGNGNVMTLSAPFGTTDSVTGDIVGYNNDLLYLMQGYGKMTIPQLAETNNLTIIAKRFVYTLHGVDEYSAFFGAEQTTSANAVWLDYREGQTFMSRNTKGEYVGRDTSEIVWMTPKYMNGHILEETEEKQMNGTCYLGKLRTNVGYHARLKVECLYVFNRELSPSEVESFIKAHIDADYVLPTIEQ